MAYDHQIPRTYLKPWCTKNDSILLFNKATGSIKPGNINNHFGRSNYYSITPFSAFQTEKSLEYFFGELRNYTISIDGLLLQTLQELCEHFDRYKNWRIVNKDDLKDISKKECRMIYDKIRNKKDSSIDQSWRIRFEDNWATFIGSVFYKVLVGQSITGQDYETLMEYIIMFDWRKPDGNHVLNDVLKWFDSIINVSNSSVPENIRIDVHDKTLFDVINHDVQLKLYHEFLFNGESSTLGRARRLFMELLSFQFIISHGIQFITGDYPSFMFKNKQGYNEQIFIALPTLLVSLARKVPGHPHMYKVASATTDEVQEYNRIIRDNSKNIVIPNQDIHTLFG